MPSTLLAFRHGALAFLGGSLLLSGSVHGQSPSRAAETSAAVPCAQGLITGGPGTPVGRWTICSEAERQVPQLVTTLAQMQRQLGAQDERMAEMQRLLRQVNAASQRAGQQQIEMARSLEKKLAAANAEPPTSSLRTIRRLGDDIEQVNEQLDAVSKDEKKRDAYRSLQASIQEAIGALELKRVDALLAGIDKIQTTLAGVDVKVDAIQKTSDEARNIALFAEAQRNRARGDQGQVAVLGQSAAGGRSFEGHDLAGMGFSKANAPGLMAKDAEMMLTWWDEADLSRADLRGAGLIAAKLERTRLHEANMRGARVAFARAQGASLLKADLSRSNWAGADLRGADLRGAKLNGASFAHADLRDADLREADLSGAFLGNADLRGARLEGSIWKNTDVSHAVVSRSNLTAAQYAGLCATPSPAHDTIVYQPRAVSWDVIERIPSGRYSGGIENAMIIDVRIDLPVQGHRPYPRCKVRTKDELAEWGPPVWSWTREPSKEDWSERLRFHAEYAVLDGARRRAELRSVIEAARSSASSRSSLLAGLPQFQDVQGTVFRLMDKRLDELTRSLPVPPVLRFDVDTALLWALRLQPQLLERVGANWVQLSRQGQWGPMQLEVARNNKEWPRLYPAELQETDISETTARAFQTWTRARAAAVGRTPVTLDARTDAVRSGFTWSQLLSLEVVQDASVAKRLGAVPDRVLVHKVNMSEALGGKGNVSSLVVIQGETSTVEAWAIAQAQYADGRLRFSVQDVRWLPQEGGGSQNSYIVWTLRLLPQA